jgi:hypothetical protein
VPDPIARRRIGGHGQRQRPVPGKQALERTQREHMPGLRHERHRGHHDDEADERPLDHHLAAVAISQAPPERRHQSRDRRRHAKADARPQSYLPDVRDAELLKVKRKERHHQREAGEADEARRRYGKEILPIRHA